jgi:hypothetical protein
LFSFDLPSRSYGNAGRKENNKHKPCGNITILREQLHLITPLCLLLSIRAYIFFFSALSAEKKKISSADSATRANLPEADKAGGE